MEQEIKVLVGAPTMDRFGLKWPLKYSDMTQTQWFDREFESKEQRDNFIKGLKG